MMNLLYLCQWNTLPAPSPLGLLSPSSITSYYIKRSNKNIVAVTLLDQTEKVVVLKLPLQKQDGTLSNIHNKYRSLEWKRHVLLTRQQPIYIAVTDIASFSCRTIYTMQNTNFIPTSTCHESYGQPPTTL